MSLFTRNAPRTRARSPSIDSILSTTQPSTLGNDDRWVIFSPSISASDSSYEQVEHGFALPGHNGSGEFPHIPREMLMDRVSRWSTEQSRIVYEELQRLEQRFLWINSSNSTVPQEPESQGSSWRTLAQRVHNLIALDDEVLDMLFGDALVTPRPQSPVSNVETAFSRSKQIHPNWDDQAVQRLLGDLGVPLAPNFSFLRDLLSIGLPQQEKEPVQPLYTAPLARDYWEDECSSLSTEIMA